MLITSTDFAIFWFIMLKKTVSWSVLHWESKALSKFAPGTNPWMKQKMKQRLLTQYVHRKKKTKLEALRERRPPWPRQIITPILLTIKNIEPWWWKTTPPPPPPTHTQRKRVLDHYLHHDLGMLPLLCCLFCSFTHLRIPRSPPKFNQFFIALPKTPP